MKISSIRVDGYGLLSNVSIEQIDPHLTVVFGPNEAGKSTLLDFVRGVLFGFPDRRRSQPFRPPLRGGRHGGALGVVDETNRSWLVERHVGDRLVTLTGPDGSLGSDVVLERLLGGADDALFRSVFAFGLAELSAIESLDRDEVQELVFSAGILGAGRSATRAVRGLETRQGLLARPRQQGAVANRLWQQLREIDSALHKAREGASGFVAAQLICNDLEETLESTRVEIDIIRQRIGELERIDTCWPTWRKQVDSIAKLASIGPMTAQSSYAIEHAQALRELIVRFSGHSERAIRRNELAMQSTGIEREINRCLEDIGGVVSGEVDCIVDVPLDVRDEVKVLATRSRDLTAELRVLSPEADRARELASRLCNELETTDTIDRPIAIVQHDIDAIRELRRLVQSRDRLESDLLSEVREARLLGVASGHHGKMNRPTVASVLAVIALGLALASAYAAYHHDIGASAGGLCAMVGAIAAALWISFRPSASIDTPSDPLIQNQRDELSRLDAQITERATSLDLALRPSLTEVELLEIRLDDEMVGAQVRADIERRAAEATQQATRATQPVLERSTEFKAVSKRISELCQRLNLPQTLSAEGLVQGVAGLVRACELRRAHLRVNAEVGELDRALDRYRTDVNVAVSALLGDGQAPPSAIDEQINLLSQLLENAAAADRDRAALEQAIESSNDILKDTLGHDLTADRLMKELATGSTTSWSDERSRLDARLDELSRSIDEMIRSRRDAERHLEDLVQSDAIARLELERNGVQSSLDDALVEYATLGVARALLSSTLTHYEQERQPAVIARAADLFKTITAQRYERIVARAQEDGRRQSIEVISKTGERVPTAELSRGSAEQLYLCLRLALAEAFAERAVALPFVLDDILVNFDPLRAQEVANVIAHVSAHHQVIAFTCHPHVVEFFSRARPGVPTITMSSTE